MRLKFTKMQGLGNDFVVVDAVRHPVRLDARLTRLLADRHYGVGCDQILVVHPAQQPGNDFRYQIFNADGSEVEHCGNGARCFLRFVRDEGLTDRYAIRVETLGGVIVPRMGADGRITVDMGVPVFAPAQIPFIPGDAPPVMPHTWGLALGSSTVNVTVLSLGNPHAVQVVEDVDKAPVAEMGPAIEVHAAFPRRVNAGFLQVLGRGRARLRVHERGSGETLACGSGACAALVAGVVREILDPEVRIATRGGELLVSWDGPGTHVRLCGEAVPVFRGEIELPDAQAH